MNVELKKACDDVAQQIGRLVDYDVICLVFRKLHKPSGNMKKVFRSQMGDSYYDNPDPEEAWSLGIDYLVGDKRMIDRIDVDDPRL